MPSLLWVPFRWESARLGERTFPHAAMFIHGSLPTVNGLSGWFQFDLGAPTTVLYGGALTAAQRAQVEAQRLPHPAMFNGQEVPTLSLPVDVGPWTIERVVYLPDFGDEETTDNGELTLGTVGGDLVREHILVVDFPGQRITRLATLPSVWQAQAHWAPLRLSPHGHVILQITVDGVPRWAMYDSGSSLFHLLTDPQQWQHLTSGQVTETFPIMAWGEEVAVQGGPTHATFALADLPLIVPVIHFLGGEERQRFLEQLDLIGILGNEPFLNHGLILDFPQKRVGLLASPLVAP